MKCVVTAGPTYETLDQVRRLTNFSTGRLGTELANFLAARGHDATLLIGEQATHPGERKATRTESFSTTADLAAKLQALGKQDCDAVFHAAAVSDFMFGKIWTRSASGELSEIKSGKISTRAGTLLAELVATPKIIASLRDWFGAARIIGWKYEVDGDRASVLKAAQTQMSDCRTDACVANGPAYGRNFGLLTPDGKLVDARGSAELFSMLERFASGR
jgi:phosphopantothenoylcysteine decarboxylase/phosphopantothenate--cysteine ligase